MSTVSEMSPENVQQIVHAEFLMRTAACSRTQKYPALIFCLTAGFKLHMGIIKDMINSIDLLQQVYSEMPNYSGETIANCRDVAAKFERRLAKARNSPDSDLHQFVAMVTEQWFRPIFAVVPVPDYEYNEKEDTWQHIEPVVACTSQPPASCSSFVSTLAALCNTHLSECKKRGGKSWAKTFAHNWQSNSLVSAESSEEERKFADTLSEMIADTLSEMIAAKRKRFGPF